MAGAGARAGVGVASDDAAGLTIHLADGDVVSGLLDMPARPSAVFVLAHGAGAGMTHPFIGRFARGMAERGIATLRYQFPFMEKGSGRPDGLPKARATVRAAVNAVRALRPDLPCFAGGKSFGGRMTSQAQAAAPLPGVRGLVFVGFPLHPAGTPSIDRSAHLSAVDCPMLFLQGTRDALALPELVEPVVASLGTHATLHWIVDADHAFHVRKTSGTTDAAVLVAMLDVAASWMARVSRVPA